MRVVFLLVIVLVTGCASIHEFDSNSRIGETDRYQSVRLIGPGVAATQDDHEVRLFDTRMIREIRALKDQEFMLALTRHQKIGMWIGIGIASSYLIAELIEDNVVFAGP